MSVDWELTTVMRIPGGLTQQTAIHATAMLGSLEMDFNVVSETLWYMMYYNYTNKNSTNEYKQLQWNMNTIQCKWNINSVLHNMLLPLTRFLSAKNCKSVRLRLTITVQ